MECQWPWMTVIASGLLPNSVYRHKVTKLFYKWMGNHYSRLVPQVRGSNTPHLFHGLCPGPSQCPPRKFALTMYHSSFLKVTLLIRVVGACGAIMEAVSSYEEDVGFSNSTCPTIDPYELDLFTHLDLTIDIDFLTPGRQRWKELAVNLMNAEIFENSNTNNDPTWTLSSVNFSDYLLSNWFLSPKAKHIFYEIDVRR